MRAAQARNLALAFLGAANAADVRLDAVIDQQIARVLEAADGSISVTADLLGMHRRSLQRHLRRRECRARRR
jgi:ActR/RegA family two-component response regulator